MFKHNIFFLLILLMTLPACIPKEKNLYGTYIAEYSFGTEKVILNPNGEYVQEVSIKKGKPKTLTQRGRWRYDPSDKYVKIENGLYDKKIGVARDKDYIPDYVPFLDGLVLMKVRRVFPSIRLGSAYEDIDFVKMK